MVDVLAAQGKYKAALPARRAVERAGQARALRVALRLCFRSLRRSEIGECSDEICNAHNHVHRKKDDLLAEFLLDQRAGVSRRLVPLLTSR